MNMKENDDITEEKEDAKQRCKVCGKDSGEDGLHKCGCCGQCCECGEK
jgi:hypothetical protein